MKVRFRPLYLRETDHWGVIFLVHIVLEMKLLSNLKLWHANSDIAGKCLTTGSEGWEKGSPDTYYLLICRVKHFHDRIGRHDTEKY